MKKIQDLKPVLHFKKDNYVYRYVLVDRFQNDSKIITKCCPEAF